MPQHRGGLGGGLGEPTIQPRTPNPSPSPREQPPLAPSTNPLPPIPYPHPFAALYTFLNLAKDEENIVNIKSLTVGYACCDADGGWSVLEKGLMREEGCQHPQLFLLSKF